MSYQPNFQYDVDRIENECLYIIFITHASAKHMHYINAVFMLGRHTVRFVDRTFSDFFWPPAIDKNASFGSTKKPLNETVNCLLFLLFVVLFELERIAGLVPSEHFCSIHYEL